MDTVISLQEPLEKTLCVGSPMDLPYLVTETPPDPQLGGQDGNMDQADREPPELVVTMLLPNEINRLVRFISQAYMTLLPTIHVSMVDRLPNLAPDTFPMTCMIWNVQGARSTAFTSSLKELFRMHKPFVLALVETVGL